MNAATPLRTEQRPRPHHLGVAALALLVAGISVVGRRPRRPVGNRHVPEPAKAVDLNRYLGLWYEFARYENRFEHGCEGVTAAYSLLPNGRVGIVNSCRKGSADGPLSAARAKAKIVAGSGDAKLRVAFFGPIYFANYWVLDHDDDYAWSIVGEPSGKYLWILTRMPTLPVREQQALIGRVRSLGYDTTLLRQTRQPPGG